MNCIVQPKQILAHSALFVQPLIKSRPGNLIWHNLTSIADQFSMLL